MQYETVSESRAAGQASTPPPVAMSRRLPTAGSAADREQDHPAQIPLERVSGVFHQTQAAVSAAFFLQRSSATTQARRRLTCESPATDLAAAYNNRLRSLAP